MAKDLLKDKHLWARLYRPDLSWKEADIVVFGIPYDGGSTGPKGSAEGPESIRSLSTSIAPITEELVPMDHLKVADLGDFKEKDREKLFYQVTEQVEELVRHNKFFTAIGGDHSVTIPVLQGIDRGIDGDLGIIHIDAHLDLNDSLQGNPLSHGCPARRGSELSSVGGPENIFFVGIRSATKREPEFIKGRSIPIITAKELSKIGTKEVIRRGKEALGDKKYIYITVDIDVLDPAFASGTGTPHGGGLTPRELLTILEGFFDLNVIGFDVVEVSPPLNPALTSSYIAGDMIKECWGYKFLKE